MSITIEERKQMRSGDWQQIVESQSQSLGGRPRGI